VAQGVGPEFKPQHCKKKKNIYIYIQTRRQAGGEKEQGRGKGDQREQHVEKT
jgi:hypothetical protein